MSFSSLLAQIKKDKQPDNGASISKSLPPNSNRHSSPSARITNSSSSSGLSLKSRSQSPAIVDDDPAVWRLKEARRKEKEKQMLAKGVTPKKPTTPATRNASASKKRVSSLPAKPLLSKPSSGSTGAIRSVSPAARPTRHKPIDPRSLIRRSSPAPKLSFKELMAQADNVKSANPPPTPPLPQPEVKNSPIKKRPYKAGSSSSSSSHLVDRYKKPSSSSPPSLGRPSSSFHNSRKTNNNNNSNNDYTSSSSSSSRLKNKDRSSKLSPNSMRPPADFPQRPKPRSAGPAPFARPSKELLLKLKKKDAMMAIPNRPSSNNSWSRSRSIKPQPAYEREKQQNSYGIDAVSDDEDESEFDRYYDTYDSEDDNFIEDDGNYEAERKRAAKLDAKRRGYDRDEIWSIFKRGGGDNDHGKRRYDDYFYDDYEDDDDDDDMEATGAEILEDEERTLKQARLDDIREQKLLEKKQLEKQRKLKKGYK